MDIFSHFLIGILICTFAFNSLGVEFLIYVSIMAVLPDFDIFLEFFRSTHKSKLLSHKGISHSYFAALIISAISGLIFSLITGEIFILAWIVGFLFYSLHVTLDALAASKIPLFYPFSKKRFRFFIDRAINLFLAIISSEILIFYLIAYFLSSELFYSNIVYYFMAFYLIYFGYKITTKIWVQLRLPKNQMMIPGILPFVYFIYENHNSETKISFKLTKKFQFLSKTIKIIETNIESDSDEMEFFMKAKSLAKKYLFFSKWEAVIPIIWKNEKEIIVLLFLAESFASGSAYSLEISFDRKSKEVIYESDGFGYVIRKQQKIDSF